ncbi:MAG: antitoxin [Candidatus Njordarchaeia archaeon]
MSVVIGVRIPKQLKEKIDELGINYTECIRKYLEELVRRELRKRVLAEIKEIRKEIGKIDGDFAGKFVREDRDGR